MPETYHSIRMNFRIEITEPIIKLLQMEEKTELVSEKDMLDYSWSRFLDMMEDGVEEFQRTFRNVGLPAPRVFWEPDCDVDFVED